MKTNCNIDVSIGCGWYSGDTFHILNLCLFEKICDEIFFTFQIAKFAISLSIKLN